MGTQKLLERVLTLTLASVCLFFLSACGLEVFVYLDMPTNPGHTALYTSSDETENYFLFQTSETGDNADYIGKGSDFSCLGTAVYYKIYNSHTRMTTVQSAISSLDSSTATQTSVAEKLLDTTYGYKPLRLKKAGLVDPMVTATGTNRYAYIRLNNYGSEKVFSNGVYYGSSIIRNFENVDPDDLPRRYENDRYGFNFCEDDKDLPSDTSVDFNPLPKEGDSDVDWTSSPPDEDEGKWFVNMYAVTVGRDATYSYSYSRVLHLGSITINQSDYKK